MVRQNRPFSGIYVIVKGEVRVELDFEGANDCGAPVELARLRRGDIFGEVSFVDNEPTSASVIPGTDAEILVIDVDVIQSLLLGDPTLRASVFPFHRDYSCQAPARDQSAGLAG
ncbi:MAG: cyclic nucleotide-binding domain-containing protein [Rhodospirillaceae bacterium]|nr:cyclic nucleotide-binding domain-containing protein [Rhodospirillaceae bacterium]